MRFRSRYVIFCEKTSLATFEFAYPYQRTNMLTNNDSEKLLQLWLDANDDPEFAIPVRLTINGQQLVIKKGMHNLYTGMREISMDLKVGNHAFLNGDIDIKFIMCNLFDPFRPCDKLFERPDGTGISMELADLFCLHKFIDENLLSTSNKVILDYVGKCLKHVKNRIDEQMEVMNNAMCLLEFGLPNVSYERNLATYRIAQLFIIEKLDIGEYYCAEVIQSTKNSLYIDYSCKWLRICDNKIVLPLLYDKSADNIYKFLNTIAKNKDCFRLDWFDDYCEKIVDKNVISQQAIEAIKKRAE